LGSEENIGEAFGWSRHDVFVLTFMVPGARLWWYFFCDLKKQQLSDTFLLLRESIQVTLPTIATTGLTFVLLSELGEL